MFYAIAFILGFIAGTALAWLMDAGHQPRLRKQK
jgi:hypothetical protein